MIEINNLTSGSVDEAFVKKVAKEVLEGENKEELDLSIAFVGQARMRKLNKKYRGKNRTTDILSFADNGLPRNTTSSALRAKSPKALEDDIRGLGELVICSREVKKNSKRYNSSFKKELAKVLIHGILHLLGYEHEKGKTEKDKMIRKEEYYLSLWQGKI